MTHVRLWYSNHSVFALSSLTLLLACSSGSAQQFVLFDATFTFTKQDADNSKPSKSHYYVRGKMLNADRPKDWVKPVDYRNGTVHIRAEVIEKPAGGAPTTWTLCYIPNKGQKSGYGCTGTGIYREKGVYERDVKMTSFWQNDNIVWEQGIKEMHLVIKDDSGGSGHAHKRTDSEKFFPTKMRITMIQVAKGATYDPKLVPNLPAKDEPKPGKAGGDNSTARKSSVVATSLVIEPRTFLMSPKRGHFYCRLTSSKLTASVGEGGLIECSENDSDPAIGTVLYHQNEP